MFLRTLTMKGFKSFADPTVLEFEPGITVVVGPNGSGKSNVVDAVGWVLGAQAPRSLRSQRMEDVIFAGTSSRPPLGRAEVSLTIDNASGLLPVDMAEVTVTRTLFRSGESEYAINGTPCRLLDVQELLADSGVGRHQHMIIGQGQLDQVLMAHPEDRRTVIEEAAGVLKHRRRRERAERRLAATEENLERLGDLVREVKRQIRPLERQAAAARSHVALLRELHAVRLHLAGRELQQLADRHAEASGRRSELTAEEEVLHRRLAELDAETARATAELSARHHDHTAAGLARAQALTERARGTLGVLRERQRSLLASLDAAADSDVVSTLEAEAAHLAEQLQGTVEAEERLAAQRRALEEDERRAGAVEEPGAEHPLLRVERCEQALAANQQQVALLRRSAHQQAHALSALHAREAQFRERARELTARLDSVLAEIERLVPREGHLTRELEAAGERREAAASAHARASEAAHQAQERRHEAVARFEALAKAWEELGHLPGRRALAGEDGVVGALADLIEVDAGWEAAFEAAVGGAGTAVVVTGTSPARDAVGVLHREGVTGTVVPSSLPAPSPAPPPSVPPDARALRPHVRARAGRGPEVASVLDRLLAGVVRVEGWERATELAAERPDLVVVTEAGDRFGPDGWRVAAGSGMVTAAAVEAAREEATAAADDARRLEAVRESAASDLVAAEAGAAQAAEALRAEGEEVASRRAEAERLRERLNGIRADEEALRADTGRASGLLAAVQEEEAAVVALRPELEERLAAARVASAEALERRKERDEARAELIGRRRRLELEQASLEERRRVLTRRRDEMERRLRGHAEERRAAAARRRRLERDLASVRSLTQAVEGLAEPLAGVAAALEAEHRRQLDAARAGGERLDELHRARLDAERRMEELRTASRAIDVQLAEVALRATALADTVRDELESEPEEAVAAPCPDLPEGVTAEEHRTRLADRLAALGPVNPLALDELAELEGRAADLEAQVQDVRSARRELQQVIRYLDEQIVDSFTAAVADVNEHFSTLAATLFPGGTGRLALTDPEDPLNTGVEIEVRPFGRNVRRISLLSGGERSLVALAFLFAVFRSRPSPFYLMDEVEAALDDVNLHRFLELVKTFRDEAQLIVVSHQKRTMETADALYGVTMAPGGSSQVVSQKVERSAARETAGSRSEAPAGAVEMADTGAGSLS